MHSDALLHQLANLHGKTGNAGHKSPQMRVCGADMNLKAMIRGELTRKFFTMQSSAQHEEAASGAKDTWG